jgi:hypothetical protein
LSASKINIISDLQIFKVFFSKENNFFSIPDSLQILRCEMVTNDFQNPTFPSPAWGAAGPGCLAETCLFICLAEKPMGLMMADRPGLH